MKAQPRVARVIHRKLQPPQLDARVRDKLAWPVVAAYWLLLAVGVALYTIVVGGVASQAMWIGALLGSLVGHALALRNVRLWFVLAVLCGIGYLGVFASPGGSNAHTFWLTFVPAVVCAYASLADRWALAACWLPTVTWMLTILDRTHTTRHLDALAVVLLGILAIVIVVFMRVRETRRVALWQSVGATPLAAPTRPVVLTEMPGAALARVVWNLAAFGLAAGLTLWLAPRLWQLEEFHRKSQVVVVRDHAGTGLPCCQDCLSSSARVAEYLDLGRGHDRAPVPGDDCRICSPQETAHRLRAGAYDGDPYIVDSVETYDYGPGYVGGSYVGGGYVGGGYSSGTVVGGSVSSSGEVGDVGTVSPSQGWSPDIAAPNDVPNTPPRYDHYEAPQAPTTVTTPVIPDYVPPIASVPPPPLPRAVPPTPPTLPHVVPPPPSPATPPAQASAPPVQPTPSPVPPTPSATATDTTPPSAPDAPSSLPHMLVYMLVGVLSFRAFTLLLRPLRRALVVRHLRTPLWPETVDQRVSNAWQLALVGLRDAGYRCDGKESPREFAHRVGVDGLDRCATILERTRYGVAIDSDDLADMQTTAYSVYGAARRRVGGFARLASLLRWPLT